MHDIRAIRSDPMGFDAGLARRGLAGVSSQILQLDTRRRGLLSELQKEQAERNARSKRIGELMRAGRTQEAAELRADIEQAVGEVQEKEVRELDEAIKRILEGLPNILD